MIDETNDEVKDLNEEIEEETSVNVDETLSEDHEDEESEATGGKLFKKSTVKRAKYQELEAKYEAALEEIDSLKDSRMRLMAEYENYKRRTQKEKLQLYSDSIATVTQDWLPVLDNLERATAAVDQLDEDSDESTIQKTADGIALINKQAVDVMAKLGVKEIEALNQPFDPEYHEAVMRVDSEDDIEPNTIVEVFAKGYIYGDRVIRHSVVKVAN